MNYYDENYLAHYGIKGMKWGVKRAKYEYKYQHGQKPKTAYQKAMRSLGGTNLAKKAIQNSKMSDVDKKKALSEQAELADEKAYNKAAKKAHKTGGQMTYDVATGKYSVGKNETKSSVDKQAVKQKIADTVSSASKSELGKRGKAAIDVLMNGDKDWMGNSITSPDLKSEASNRGKAALERLMYSQEQIDNKKFFGRYDF